MFGPSHDLELLRKWQDSDDPNFQLEERDVLAIRYFLTRLLFTQVNPEWSIQGCSFSQRGANVLLVVKGTHEDTQYVAYVTERNTISCVRIFARQWLEGRVKWHKDKYA